MRGSPSCPLTHNLPTSCSLVLDCRYTPLCQAVTNKHIYVCWIGCFVFDVRSCYAALAGLELGCVDRAVFQLVCCSCFSPECCAYRHLQADRSLVTCSASPASPECFLFASLGLVLFYFDGRNLAGFHMHVTEIELLFFGCILPSVLPAAL